MDASWLEAKAAWHSAAAVVADFHAAIHAAPDFVPTAKLLLQVRLLFACCLVVC